MRVACQRAWICEQVRLDTGVTTSEVAFVPATFALRPPRVAIVFLDDDHWRDWVMRALLMASERWGGGGFILVPHSASGEPAPQFAQIVRAYDPDHVVTVNIPVPEFEEWYPGSIPVTGVPKEDRADFIRLIRDDTTSSASEHARDVVSSWCSPLRSARMVREQPVRQHEVHKSLHMVQRNDRLPRGLPVAPPLTSEVLAACSEWRTDLALFAAGRAGVVRDHDQPRPEPGVEVIAWGIQHDSDDLQGPLRYTPPGSASVTGAVPPLFDTHPGLMRVSRGFVRDVGGVVVGNSGTDFALALAYDKILGRGYWVSTAMMEDPDTLEELRSSLWWAINQVEQQAATLTISSTSLDDDAVAAAAEKLQEPTYEFERGSRHRQMVEESETVQVRAPNIEHAFTEVVVSEHVGVSSIVPMATLEDGTLESLTGVEAPVPSSLMYSVGSGRVPYWYVDVSFGRVSAPYARDLPGSALQAVADGQYPEVTARASKDGISFNPASLGFVSSGSLLPGRLGKPRLRALSMRSWVEGMAAAAGLGVRVSAAGRQSELVSKRLGSRDALLNVITPATAPTLRAFIPHKTVPKTREEGNVVIGVDPYLSFTKIASLMPSETATVKLIDTLSEARLLRRGLILNCSECGRISFVDADRIGQHYECPQCAAMNILSSPRWHRGNEPVWFYDLYAPFRDLMRDHGDIPVLAAARLRKSSQGYSDAPELEFFELESGDPVAEIDVIARSGSDVVLVEAKSNGKFTNPPRGPQTKKLLRIADALRANTVILATSLPEWNATDAAHLEREAAKMVFPVVGATMTDLDTA